MVYDRARQTTFLLMGTPLTTETWEWNGTSWYSPVVAPTPAPRFGAAAAYDDARSQIMIFGGSGSRADVWTASYENGDEEACTSGLDRDHDGAAGCADLDCAMICTPLCVPDEPCEAALPRCGDGTCSSLENAHECPADCAVSPLCGDTYCDAGEAQSCPGDC
jgi:hypothetical protein